MTTDGITASGKLTIISSLPVSRRNARDGAFLFPFHALAIRAEMDPFHARHKGRPPDFDRQTFADGFADAILIATWSWPKYPPRPPGQRAS